MREHKEQQQAEFKALKKEWTEDGLVFPTVNGTIPNPRNITEKFERIRNKANINHGTMHTLRHTYCTWAFELDIEPKIVSEQLGHKDIRTTYNTYIHVMPNKKRKELEKLNALDSLTA